MLLAFDYDSLSHDADVDQADVGEWKEAATKDEDPVIQIKISPRGAWHRPILDRSHTGCGKPFGACATRDAVYVGKLCDEGCFSPFELELAATANAEADAERARKTAIAEGESQLARDVAEVRRRGDTARNRRLESSEDE